jgi:metallo-beta-lactamase family protein
MTPSRPSLRFLGGTRTVTGSRFLVESGDARVLVDCGLFQGLKDLRKRNWDTFPVPPESIDAVVLSHAHIDHSGYLPALVRQGFKGPVFCSPDTAALTKILLTDSAHLQEEEARYANKKGYSRHSPALPLYTDEDAQNAIKLLEPQPFDEPFPMASGIEGHLRWAGHILGSASIAIDIDGPESTRRAFFSGDVGRPEHPILKPPAPPPAADVMLIESTYGDRRHATDDDDLAEFAEAISATARRGGMVLIPAFAVDRTEVVLDALHGLERDGRIPELPIYVDSPMALNVLGLYRQALRDDHPGIRPEIVAHDPFDTARVTECRTVQESMALTSLSYPSIIISASGMATGGRVLHHLRRLLPDPLNTVILSGFQVEGTRGRRLADGERTVKMFGTYVPVRADVHQLESFSVHADLPELCDWLDTAPEAPDVCYLIHGSEDASAAMRDAVDDRFGWTAVVPRPMERVII